MIGKIAIKRGTANEWKSLVSSDPEKSLSYDDTKIEIDSYKWDSLTGECTVKFKLLVNYSTTIPLFQPKTVNATLTSDGVYSLTSSAYNDSNCSNIYLNTTAGPGMYKVEYKLLSNDANATSKLTLGYNLEVEEDASSGEYRINADSTDYKRVATGYIYYFKDAKPFCFYLDTSGLGIANTFTLTYKLSKVETLAEGQPGLLQEGDGTLRFKVGPIAEEIPDDILNNDAYIKPLKLTAWEDIPYTYNPGYTKDGIRFNTRARYEKDGASIPGAISLYNNRTPCAAMMQVSHKTDNIQDPYKFDSNEYSALRLVMDHSGSSTSLTEEVWLTRRTVGNGLVSGYTLFGKSMMLGKVTVPLYYVHTQNANITTSLKFGSGSVKQIEFNSIGATFRVPVGITKTLSLTGTLLAGGAIRAGYDGGLTTEKGKYPIQLDTATGYFAAPKIRGVMKASDNSYKYDDGYCVPIKPYCESDMYVRALFQPRGWDLENQEPSTALKNPTRTNYISLGENEEDTLVLNSTFDIFLAGNKSVSLAVGTYDTILSEIKFLASEKKYDTFYLSPQRKTSQQVISLGSPTYTWDSIYLSPAKSPNVTNNTYAKLECVENGKRYTEKRAVKLSIGTSDTNCGSLTIDNTKSNSLIIMPTYEEHDPTKSDDEGSARNSIYLGFHDDQTSDNTNPYRNFLRNVYSYYMAVGKSIYPYKIKDNPHLAAETLLGDSSHRWDHGYINTLHSAVSSGSDKRMKKDIKYLDSGKTTSRKAIVEFISKLRPTTFKYKDEYSTASDNSTPRLGFIAQDMEETSAKVYSLVGSKFPKENTKDDYEYGIRDLSLTAAAIVAIQELMKENAELKDRLAKIEEKLASL